MRQAKGAPFAARGRRSYPRLCPPTGHKQTQRRRLRLGSFRRQADTRAVTSTRVRCRGRKWPASFDHLVGAAEEREWEGDAEGFGRLEIKQQLDFRDLLDRQIGRLVTLEDASGIDTGLPV
jgi:hypothetical protein